MTNNVAPTEKLVANKPQSAETDGIDHINIDIHGKTELGVLLAHFTFSHFTHPILGGFDSMEGYWHYTRAAVPNDKLRKLSGAAAYALGKRLPHVQRKAFRRIIMDGNYQKILQNDHLRKLLVESELPFMQYFTWGPEAVPINPPTAPWLVPDMEKLRKLFKKGGTLAPPDIRHYQDILGR